MFFASLWTVVVLAAATCAVTLATASTHKKPYPHNNNDDKQKKLQIHLVSHTHDDTGWLKTVNQYYLGMNNTIQFAGVRYILDTVIESLSVHPDRKFTYVEMAYFSRWWDEQPETIREKTRRLVANGQLQFANGGWCMHDEAAAYYVDMIDQTTLGHRFLLESLGVIPKIGWQVDPFGHSATNAALLSAKVWFDALYFGRLDYRNFAYREATKSREFFWHASPSMPKATLFSGVLLGNLYCAPKKFGWDVDENSVEPIQDDPYQDDYNYKEKMAKFYEHVEHHTAVTLGNHVMWTMGCDFNYQDAHYNFKNIDKLIELVRKDGLVDIFYSTPFEYTQAKLSEGNITWPVLEGDFFPYASSPHQYWTGYYTSRPAWKRYLRSSSGYYTVSRQLQSIANVVDANRRRSPLSEIMGVGQHHDSVTGTAKQHVTFDYAKLMHNATMYDLAFVGDALKAMVLPPGTNTSDYSFDACLVANQSECHVTERLSQVGDSTTVVVWNGLGYGRWLTIDVPLTDAGFTFTSRGGGDNSSQPEALAIDFVASPIPVSNYHWGFNPRSLPVTAVVNLFVPALGYETVSITRTTVSEGRRTHENVEKASHDTNGIRRGAANGAAETMILMRSDHVMAVVSLDPARWLLNLTELSTGTTLPIVQDWCLYQANQGDAVDSAASGAYIFRPATNQSCQRPCDGYASTARLVHQSQNLTIIERRVCSWIIERLLLGATDHTLRHQFTVGPVPIDGDVGREVMSRFRTTLATNQTFYTDSNGREMQRRVLNTRSNYPFTQTEPIAGNVYPVNAVALLKDEIAPPAGAPAAFAVLVDSSVGGTSLHEGELQLMVHRRLLKDDGFGVGEALNETDHITPYYNCVFNPTPPCGMHYGQPLIVRGEHRLAVGSSAAIAKTFRRAMDEAYLPAPLFFLNALTTSATRQSEGLRLEGDGADATSRHSRGSHLPDDLPANVQLVTLQRLNRSTVIVRVGHRFAIDEDDQWSQPAVVNVCTLASAAAIRKTVGQRGRGGGETGSSIVSIQETTLTTNQAIGPSFSPQGGTNPLCSVTLTTLDIRTFLIDSSSL